MDDGSPHEEIASLQNHRRNLIRDGKRVVRGFLA